MAIQPTTIVKHFTTTNTSTAYNVNYLDHDILTIVTKSPNVVSSWVTRIQSTHKPTIVGLDTESQNPISTLQLCVGNNCLIYQLIHSPIIPFALRDFLSNPTWKFVGVGVKSDVNLLVKNYELGVKNWIDVSRLAADKGIVRVNAGLKEVVNAVLDWDVEKCKEVTMSNWCKDVLDDSQVMYACLDAFLSYQIGIKVIEFDCEDDELETKNPLPIR